MTSAFQDLIKNTTLTKKESQIADYVLNNFREVCFMTSTELAEKTADKPFLRHPFHKGSRLFRLYGIPACNQGTVQRLY